jgi:hypothetical protein
MDWYHSVTTVMIVARQGNTYEVTGNEATVGTYPAGTAAGVGSFDQSQAFKIERMDVPEACAYEPKQP